MLLQFAEDLSIAFVNEMRLNEDEENEYQVIEIVDVNEVVFHFGVNDDFSVQVFWKNLEKFFAVCLTMFLMAFLEWPLVRW